MSEPGTLVRVSANHWRNESGTLDVRSFTRSGWEFWRIYPRGSEQHIAVSGVNDFVSLGEVQFFLQLAESHLSEVLARKA